MTNCQLDFLVIGAQKCATTWLHKCLKEHPELHLSAKKREHEFLGGDLYEEKGADWFFSLLEGGREGQKIGAVSVEYLFDARSPGVVNKYAPGVRLITSMRNPVERIVSAYFWYVRKGLVPELPLEDGLRKAVEAFNAGTVTETDSHYRELITRGFYAEQLERYLDLYPVDQLFAIDYEDVQRAPLEVLRQLCRFLGVSDDFTPASLNVKPKQNSYLKLFVSLEKHCGQNRYLNKSLDILNQAVNRLIGARSRPSLPDDLKQDLSRIYQPHNQALDGLLARLPGEQKTAGFQAASDW